MTVKQPEGQVMRGQAALARARADLEVAEQALQAVPHQDAAATAFADEVRELLGDAEPDPQAVRRAVRLAVAEQAWVQRLGVMLDSKGVEELLGVSRQRVSVLAKEHRLVALPKSGGGYQFPGWQFARTDGPQRSSLARAHQTLVDVGGISPWSAAAWLLVAQPDLGGKDAVAFLTGGGDPELLAQAAARDADRAAQ